MNSYELIPIVPSKSYSILKGNGEGVADLPYITVENGGYYSVWYCSSFWARVLFLFFGRIGFYCLSSAHPPISIVVHREIQE